MLTRKEEVHLYANNWCALRLWLLALAAFALCAPLSAKADAVTDWNTTGLAISSAAGQGPNPQSRTMAIMHAAIFDSVNAIDPRYTVYAVSPPVTLPASPDAAAAAAGYGVLVRLFPTRKPALDVQYAASLALIPDGDAKSNGIAVGEFVAVQMVALRSADGSAPITYTLPPAGLGIWRPTSAAPPASPQWGGVTPFLLESATQYQVPDPPSLTSAEYAMDVNECKLYGGTTSILRSADQTELARFWVEPGTLAWNRIARAMVAERQTGISENARLFALLNMSFADAAIVVWETKYRFNFWRPIHAIRENDGTTQYDDGNPDTVPDPTWTPLIATPNHPESLSGHSGTSSAAAEVLTQIFGQHAAFTTTSTSLPDVVRSYSSFWDASREVTDARVFGGIHFRRTCVISNEVGRKIGKFAVKSYMRPISDN